MIEKPRLLLIVILIALCGVFGLYVYAVSIESKTMSIGDLDSGDIGSMVEVEGHVMDVELWSSGDMSLHLIDRDSGKIVEVTIDSDTADDLNNQDKLVPGAKLRVSGLVEDYKGELQIHVMSTEGITLLNTAHENVLPLGILLDRPEIFEGSYVVVRGTVWEIEEIESLGAVKFTLQNSSGGDYRSISCIVFNLSSLRDRDGYSIHSGDEIIFEGYFGYYDKEGFWQISSEEGDDGIEKVEL